MKLAPEMEFENSWQAWVDANGSRSPSVRAALLWQHSRDKAAMEKMQGEICVNCVSLGEQLASLTEKLRAAELVADTLVGVNKRLSAAEAERDRLQAIFDEMQYVRLKDD